MSSQLQEHYNRASTAVQPHYEKVQPYLRKARQHIDPHLAPIDKELSRFPSLNRLEQRTGVPKAYIGVGAFLTFASFIFFNVFAQFLSNLVGFVLPAMNSLKALQTQTPYDDTQWLTYWAVYGFFVVIEGMVDFIIYWFPFYYTFKVIFLLWLALPQTKGAKVVYANVLRPLVFGTPKGALPKGYYSSSPSTLSSSTSSAGSSKTNKTEAPSATTASSTAIPSSSSNKVSSPSTTSREVPTSTSSSTSTAAPTSTSTSTAAPTSTSTSTAAPTSTSPLNSTGAPSIPPRVSPPTSSSAIPSVPPRGSPTSPTSIKSAVNTPATTGTATGTGAGVGAGAGIGALGSSALNSPTTYGSSLASSTSVPSTVPGHSTYDSASGLNSSLSGTMNKDATPTFGETAGVGKPSSTKNPTEDVTPGVGAKPISNEQPNLYGKYEDRFHAEQAIKAAQKAQALDGIDGHVPSDLEQTVDALAKGDFVQADRLNPFQ